MVEGGGSGVEGKGRGSFQAIKTTDRAALVITDRMGPKDFQTFSFDTLRV